MIARALAIGVLLAPSVGRAEGSGGSGGLGPGEHVEIPWEETEYWLYVPADYREDTPEPLLMFLHGDEGDPRNALLFRIPPIWRARQDAIVLLPRAPYAGGSWWQDNENHSVWLTNLVDAVMGLYNVDLDRVTSGGVSGGSYHLAFHALQQQDRYAAVHFVAGTCCGRDFPTEECGNIAARWLTGADDPRIVQARELHDQMEADSHGHELEWVELPGVGHQIDDGAEWEAAYDWLVAHEHGCATGDSDSDTDSDTDSDSDSDGDLDADGDGDDYEPRGACACAAHSDPTPGEAAIWMLLASSGLASRRRR